MSIQQTIKNLLATKAGKAMQAEIEKAEDVKRDAKAKELQAVREEAQAETPKLLEAERLAEAKVAAARQAYESAGAALRDAHQATLDVSHRHQHHEGRLQRELRAMAPPEIAAFQRFVRSFSEAVRLLAEPWSPRREARLKVTEKAAEAVAAADILATSGMAVDDIRTELRRMVAELRTLARKVGEPLGHGLMEGDPFANVDTPEAA